jgi:hypothetical protein
MFLVLTLFRWCAVLGECRCPNIFPFNSRLGEFNSRLGGLISRFGLLREIAGNGLIQLTIFPAKRRLSGQIDDFSRFDGKKPGKSPPPTGLQLPDNAADQQWSGMAVLSLANRGQSISI